MRTAHGFVVVPGANLTPGRRFVVCLRPERIRMLPANETPAPSLNAIKGEVRDVIFVGETTTYHVKTELHERLQATELNAETTTFYERGDAVWLVWAPDAMLLLPPTATNPETGP